MRSATVKKIVFFLLAVIMLPAFTACNQDRLQNHEYLIRVGDITATSDDFNRFWDSYAASIYANADVDTFFVKAGMNQVRNKTLAYPFLICRLIKAKVDIRAFFSQIGMKEIKMEAFDQFLIAMLIEARAQDLGIMITSEELDAEMKRMMDEYTDDVFKETLGKAAIPFEAWRDGLGRRLLMERVMRVDLYAHGEITPEDVDRFGGLRGGLKASPEEVLERVYRAKAENDFQRWTEELQYKYPVDINYDQWMSILNGQ